MELRVRGSAQEALLLRLLGIVEREGLEPCALLLGRAEEPPDSDEPIPYLRLPDPDNPLQETDRLARLLGQAIGIGKVHL